jgi:hypothetical protein
VGDKLHTHLVHLAHLAHLGVMEHLLRRVQVLHGMGVWIPRRHATHEGCRIDLLAWA